MFDKNIMRPCIIIIPSRCLVFRPEQVHRTNALGARAAQKERARDGAERDFHKTARIATARRWGSGTTARTSVRRSYTSSHLRRHATPRRGSGRLHALLYDVHSSTAPSSLQLSQISLRATHHRDRISANCVVHESAKSFLV